MEKCCRFENLFNRMGGFHRALNYMGDIGKIMEGNGFEDCLVEAGAYSGTVISKIMAGKAYNRGIRAHKLLFEDSNGNHLFLGQRKMIYIFTMSIENYC